MKEMEPLTESYFYILLCLYRGPNHGYGIMQMTQRLSEGRVTIGPGTMYGATGSMIKKGWIEELKDPQEGRRRLYTLTVEGRAVLEAEVQRLKGLLKSAREEMSDEQR